MRHIKVLWAKSKEGSSMELDKALEFAVILSWEDLMKVAMPASVRVEYPT